ncbi:hypothetical protein Poly24_53280 [Rosistilla carotiformis]|uniref:Uncharacterized protein n=1 Tax=Rosistilla carotiformis TaxID=2528017 RepID=A0A518K1C4_9BACT|nr:hypothetical protein Poly24_53280 [Rosistilla carotiformis]
MCMEKPKSKVQLENTISPRAEGSTICIAQASGLGTTGE